MSKWKLAKKLTVEDSIKKKGGLAAAVVTAAQNLRPSYLDSSSYSSDEAWPDRPGWALPSLVCPPWGQGRL